MRKTYLHRVAQTAILTAVLTVLSQIAIPTPWNIPFTLQTFGVALCGYLLGPWYGTASIVVYIALGAIGVPVFSGFKGSIGALAGMTGGYFKLYSFMVCAITVSAMVRLFAYSAVDGGKVFATSRFTRFSIEKYRLFPYRTRSCQGTVVSSLTHRASSIRSNV